MPFTLFPCERIVDEEVPPGTTIEEVIVKVLTAVCALICSERAVDNSHNPIEE